MKGKKIDLIRRQIKELLNQANKIKSSNRFVQDVKEFSSFSLELKNYIAANLDNDNIKSICNKIPDIDTKNLRNRYWYHYIFLVYYNSCQYNDQKVKEDVIPIIESINNYYSLILYELDTLHPTTMNNAKT